MWNHSYRQPVLILLGLINLIEEAAIGKMGLCALAHPPNVSSTLKSFIEGSLTSCEILGKAEFMNPGGSVKDRAALGIIEQAELDGQLRPGHTIVEGTAGNTGIGLTIIGHARGYKTVIVIPETQSPEKISLLRALGAEVITVPEKPYSDSGNYNHVAKRLAVERSWFWANQFDNQANRTAHFRGTGPEVWEQTAGRVTSFVSSVGTGGTLAGVALYLKVRNPSLKIGCADPFGAAMWSWFTHGHTNIADGNSFADPENTTFEILYIERLVPFADIFPRGGILTVVPHQPQHCCNAESPSYVGTTTYLMNRSNMLLLKLSSASFSLLIPSSARNCASSSRFRISSIFIVYLQTRF